MVEREREKERENKKRRGEGREREREGEGERNGERDGGEEGARERVSPGHRRARLQLTLCFIEYGKRIASPAVGACHTVHTARLTDRECPRMLWRLKL